MEDKPGGGCPKCRRWRSSYVEFNEPGHHGLKHPGTCACGYSPVLIRVNYVDQEKDGSALAGAVRQAGAHDYDNEGGN